MATYKTHLQSEKEIQRMLEETGSEGVMMFHQKVIKVQKVKVTVTEIEEDPVEKSESSDSDTTTPPLGGGGNQRNRVGSGM